MIPRRVVGDADPYKNGNSPSTTQKPGRNLPGLAEK